MTAPAEAAKALSSLEIFWWGVLGGLVALLVTQILPAAFVLMKSETGPRITFWRVLGALIIFAGCGAAGGAAALIIGKDDMVIKDALVYGMAWEAILGGAVKTGRAALPDPPTPNPPA